MSTSVRKLHHRGARFLASDRAPVFPNGATRLSWAVWEDHHPDRALEGARHFAKPRNREGQKDTPLIRFGFEDQSDAEVYLTALLERLAKFSLRLAMEKSGLVKFNCWEPESSGTFTFLGFDFYWAPTYRNSKKRVVKRKTNNKKYRASIPELQEWIKSKRSMPLRMNVSSLRKKLRGYWNDYRVIANSEPIWRYMNAVTELMFKWLNRRSQRTCPKKTSQ